MNLNVLQNLKMVHQNPYPYLCIDNALPENIYNELENTFPEKLVCSVQPGDNGITYRYKCNPALIDRIIPQIWVDFFQYHSSEAFFKKCISVFKEGIYKHYGKKTYDKLIDNSVAIRKMKGAKEARLVTDCQFVVHEPVSSNSTSRPAHMDNPSEIYAGLLYLRKHNDNSTGGNFTIHETTGKITKLVEHTSTGIGGRNVTEDVHQPIFEVPYKANQFCMFLNAPESVHSVTPRLGAVERRRSINMIGCYKKKEDGLMWEVEHIK